MEFHRNLCSFIIGVVLTALEIFGIDTQNDRGDMLIGFAEKKLMKDKRKAQTVKLTMKST